MPKIKQKDLAKYLPDYILDLDFIVFMEFGSKLYGTDTKDSDTDFKGIYLPTKEQVLLNRIPKSVSYKSKPDKKDMKNSKDDVDCQVFSLHYFLELAAKGETVAIDMLHAPDDWPVYNSDLWYEIRKRRQLFHCKSLKAFVGYARKQAAKYGLKGTRIDAAQKVLDFMGKEITEEEAFNGQGNEVRLANVWGSLPEGEHIHKLDADESKRMMFRTYQVCGKRFQETAKLSYIVPILEKFLDQYGHRAKLAQKNEGVDWKAMSHAIRAAMQVLLLFTMKDIMFPLPSATFLREVKQGKYDFSTKVLPMLEMYMQICESAALEADLPENVDVALIDKFLIEVMEVIFNEKNSKKKNS
jgi:hypothetical protein